MSDQILAADRQNRSLVIKRLKDLAGSPPLVLSASGGGIGGEGLNISPDLVVVIDRNELLNVIWLLENPDKAVDQRQPSWPETAGLAE